MEPLIGEIRAFSFNEAPDNWVKCEGQLLPIARHTDLFAILGIQFGGNGIDTFGIPDLRGRTIIGEDDLYNYKVGQQVGTETETLATKHLPEHSHFISGVKEQGNSFLNNGDDYLAQFYTTEGTHRILNGYRYYSGEHMVALNEKTIYDAGEGKAHNNIMPSLVITWCIAIEGVYPTRS